jgi:hypothetical protein
MWETYIVGASQARIIYISKELKDAIRTYQEKTGLSIQFLFDSGLYELIRLWGGGTPALEPASEEDVQRVRHILHNNPMPGKVDYKKRDHQISVNISSERGFQWLINLEELAILPSFSDGIRRIITYNLRKENCL